MDSNTAPLPWPSLSPGVCANSHLVFWVGDVLSIIISSSASPFSFCLQSFPALGFPDSSVGQESACNAGDSSVGKIRWRRDRLPASVFLGFPFGSRICLQCRRPGFCPWVEIPWRRARLPSPVFWPGEFHGLYGPWGSKESDMTERLSLSL